ncbi:unnamed protein product [Dovyalis caffra]|uniref:Bulb-type lectin domain-containing protein n=1 Tax=Dovyalis caffra TaxID=77055 RepID=A0AAV1RWE0_9ROSI|nr:unnamed protein product [Dovyalis caffra]
MFVMTKLSFLLLVLLSLCVSYTTSFSIGGDTLLVGQSLSANQTLISQGSIFELGFFKPGASSNIYLGVWYKNCAEKITVWVANRESPLNDPASLKLELSPDGYLVLLTNFTKTVWSTTPTSSMPKSTAEAELSDARCRLDCIRICSCVAYAYNNSGCFLWEGALINLQEAGIAVGGRTGADIYIRLSASELQHQIASGSPRIGVYCETVLDSVREVLDFLVVSSVLDSEIGKRSL